MSLLALPTELLIILGHQLPTHDLYSLILTNRRFYTILSPHLQALATHHHHAVTALYWAVLTNNPSLATHVLANATNITILLSARFIASTPDIPGSYLPQTLKPPLPHDAATLAWVMQQGGRLRLIAHHYSFSTTALKWAVQHAQHSLLKLVLDTEAYESMVSTEEALLQGARLGGEKAVGMLLERGVSPNGERVARGKPLEMAVRNGHVGVVRLLLGSGVDMMDERGSLQEKYVRIAENRGDEVMAVMLRGYGAGLEKSGLGMVG